MSEQHPLIGRVAQELRRSVEVSPSFDRKVVEAAVRDRRRRRLVGVGGGVVALAASVAAVVWLARSPAAGSGAAGVEFSIELPSARAVSLVGDFNDWDRGRTPLRRVGASSKWATTVPLRRGGLYRYAFLVDGVQFIADPRQPGPLDADYGQAVSLLTVE